MRILSVIVGIFLSFTLSAQVTIYAIDIPGLHEKKGGGIYDKPINEALVNSGKATIKVLPPARAEKSFASCSNCCLSPANLNPEFYSFGDGVVRTEPMGIAKIYIFSRPGEAVLTSLGELKGKKIGIRNGMPYGKSFESAGLKTSGTSEISNNISKLEAKRIDAMVAYVPDAYDAFEALGKDPFPHAKESPIAVHPDALVCKGVAQDVIEAFNAHVKN